MLDGGEKKELRAVAAGLSVLVVALEGECGDCGGGGRGESLVRRRSLTWCWSSEMRCLRLLSTVPESSYFAVRQSTISWATCLAMSMRSLNLCGFTSNSLALAFIAGSVRRLPLSARMMRANSDDTRASFFGGILQMR